MFPGESYDPVLSGWSSEGFSSDVAKGGEAYQARTGYGRRRRRPWRHTPPGAAGWERKRDGEFVTSAFATYTYVGIVGNQGSIQTVIEDCLQSVKCPTRDLAGGSGEWGSTVVSSWRQCHRTQEA